MNEALPISHYADLFDALRFPHVVNRLAEFFVSRGYEAYLVGGTVRDALAGREFEDIDIAVNGDAFGVSSELAEFLGGHCAPLDSEWRVARVLLYGADCSMYVDVAAVKGCGIEHDLRRRDFTINAMALPLDAALSYDSGGQLLDPCGGLRDLRRGVVRMTSPDVFAEDPARMMRSARLATQFGYSTERGTADAIRADASRIGGASQERVRDELMRLLESPNAYDGVRLLDELGLLCAVIPELAQAKGVTQPKEHCWDVFDHLVEAVGWLDAMFRGGNNPLSAMPKTMPLFEGMGEYFGEDVCDGYDRLAFLKLAALLHDIAKPTTKTVEPSGRIRFFEHHTEGAWIARDVLMRMRFSNRGVEHVAGMVRHHLRPRQMAQNGDMPTRRALYRYYRDVGDVALDTLYLNTADYLAARGPMLEEEEWEKHCRLIRHILEEGRLEEGELPADSVKSLPKLVDGYDIMEGFALASGPEIGVLLEEVREAQASGEISTREQALELVRTSLERGGEGA